MEYSEDMAGAIVFLAMAALAAWWLWLAYR